ncbi:ECF-type riboflavin transporter substrate-binding protein [Clostridium oryzae]|uniref:Uncharacterized protein n=1 Tax=Clostridium oryzae TaxID=1450648 RepID=A0A1V4I657_9CLOT|nr:ECF-type riboflavin transporter substrate-binding protein [Clostridium oryzae]OPJ55359.1 hypothetical protein CLORY_44250 [Clostridium oryzae]
MSQFIKGITGFFKSLVAPQGIVAIIIVLLIIVAVAITKKKSNTGRGLSTRNVVAVGIGAALYGVLSIISIPIGPNTSFRLAIALLIIFGAIFGPTVGFLVGFIGNALNDAFSYGQVWWSWALLSATIGLFAGFLTLDKDFDVLAGKINKIHFAKLYAFAIVSLIVGCIFAFCGDVFLYGESAAKVLIQALIAALTDFAVIAVIGIPVTIAIAKLRQKNNNLELDE